MFDDIVICEMYHSDPLGNEYCNPESISIGMTNDNSIMVTLIFGDHGLRKVANANRDVPLEINVENLDNTKIEIKDKYDVQEAVKVSITDTIEIYDMLIGSNGLNFPHFTNIPAINNTTDFGNAIFLNFPHAVEGFTYKGQQKIFD
tara:strand:- start:1993 stop:2430 length:438 start_codon:yes stop_codon:yes gene_type:complete